MNFLGPVFQAQTLKQTYSTVKKINRICMKKLDLADANYCLVSQAKTFKMCGRQAILLQDLHAKENHSIFIFL